MHEVLVNLKGGLRLPRKSVVRLTDSPNMTIDVYPGCKTTQQQQLLITLKVPKKQMTNLMSAKFKKNNSSKLHHIENKNL